MSDTTVTSAALDPVPGERFARLSEPLGIRGFGANLITLQPRQRGRIHRHLRQEEVYVVLEGALTIALEGEERTYGEREIVRVPPEVKRQLMNRGAAPAVFLALGCAGDHAQAGGDGIGWPSWDDTGEGISPRDLPAPTDLPE
jgi:quercetin dioxygenase-like cupin family protein